MAGTEEIRREVAGNEAHRETTIIIPATDIIPTGKALLWTLLESVRAGSTEEDFEIVVCFDQCTDQLIEQTCLEFPFVVPIINSLKRKGFAGNANLGLRYAHEKGNNALCVNQDCILPESKYLKWITEAPGLCSPLPTSVCDEPPFDPKSYKKLLDLQPESPEYSEQNKLVGFCLFFSWKFMDEVGLFDEFFVATFEDDDICARALLAGFPVQQVNVLVHHYVSRCGAYDDNRLGFNLQKYRNKWMIPQEIEHADMNAWIAEHHEWSDEMRVI